ncbi:hypothetical protein FGSG_08962 [Fusarium graminearum PH-1]|uniref:Chromosome 4, complete genome n=1 Tax=Gibberella zeae (strain ATCC MYA-4620 / CBS 123657 / FGSC 9075 / NRRL 31084 / PH-1) TaxID=229533 RepID=I1RXA5_GIBZE|nr:hypothetical protein FGSG_08962 [Fusarium graminearum PH-1]ESU15463.1 hypothetical protein FGSG_08962 [Fusarium graminearum PH-1]CEF83440.1 unnamed protein product [Fusarium graminearum]|eukprot:XP_011328853.1 hypothetical protein FGSG_08962 [Fusarium graminearum PH-1]
MAPNIAESQHLLIRDMILSKSQDGVSPKDDKIAATTGCSTRTVRTIRSNLRRFGTTRAPPNKTGRPKTITPNMFTALSDRLANRPWMRLTDMAAFLRKEFDVDVSRFSLSRALRSAEWRKKVTRNVEKERNADLREEHVYERSEYRSYQLVFIDESGCDRSIGTKHKGWAPRGVTPIQVKRFHRGRRFQILPAYSQDGVIHFRVFEGSTDSEIFENFVEELLPYCGRWPEPRSVLIMDNATFHHSEKIQRLCDEAGVVLKFLPPYSPDLNPIEEYFGELKTYIKQVWDEYEDVIRHNFGLFLEECVRTVGERQMSARGHFRRAGISIEEQPS